MGKIIKLNTVEGRMKNMMMVRVGLRTKVRKGVVLIKQMLKILGRKMMQSLRSAASQRNLLEYLYGFLLQSSSR